jgi:hypothetical protein
LRAFQPSRGGASKALIDRKFLLQQEQGGQSKLEIPSRIPD